MTRHSSHIELSCLHQRDYERISRGTVRRSDVEHLFRCAVCRAGLLLYDETFTGACHGSVETSQRLAAASSRQDKAIMLATEDGLLTCDVHKMSDGNYEVTVVADPAEWTDTVALWPGPGTPHLLPVGASQVVSRDSVFSLEQWYVGKAELEWSGDLASEQTIPAPHNGLRIQRDENGFRMDWYGQTSALLGVLGIDGDWNSVLLPRFSLPEGNTTCRIFTPLSAKELRV